MHQSFADEQEPVISVVVAADKGLAGCDNRNTSRPIALWIYDDAIGKAKSLVLMIDDLLNSKPATLSSRIIAHYLLGVYMIHAAARGMDHQQLTISLPYPMQQ